MKVETLQNNEWIRERRLLALERIAEIGKEEFPDRNFDRYFHEMSAFLLDLNQVWEGIGKQGLLGYSLEELREINERLYRDILPEHYESSFGNPAYAVTMLGEEMGRLLTVLYREIRSAIPFCFRAQEEELVIRMELFVEVYSAFAANWAECGTLADGDSVRQILYWFVSDYSDVAAMETVRNMVVPGDGIAARMPEEADGRDLRYLYGYGEYVGENELEMADFLAGLPQETIDLMADTYTTGYRVGFEVTGKDLSKKKVVELYYPIGFERVMKKAVANFRRMGLEPVGRNHSTSLLYGAGSAISCHPNRQYEFDHKDDIALLFDKAYACRKQEVFQTALEAYKEQARGYAGPAVVEIFGEKDFDPVNKPEAVRMTETQSEQWVEFRSQYRGIQRRYIPEDERSYTIIAFPVPEIRSALAGGSMEVYRKFFEEIIRVNTLDYQLYRKIQETLIEALDRADTCEIRGRNGNRTDLTVNLYKLTDPAKQTIFENCVADVNIPVGEVFTSPVLKGTNGVLHVSRVFLNGLEYRDLEIWFQDGMVSDYRCGNFADEKENRIFIRENVLFRHKTLPMGEFAIGTNTTAYMVAEKYGVQSKLPILIAEKTGPHFALGDTCYSHVEDVRVYNPDGREIVARDNEVSILRKTNPSAAYLNCHTDITIPYDELGELVAVTGNGERIPILREGRFVLPGTEKLNEPFGEMLQKN